MENCIYIWGTGAYSTARSKSWALENAWSGWQRSGHVEYQVRLGSGGLEHPCNYDARWICTLSPQTHGRQTACGSSIIVLYMVVWLEARRRAKGQEVKRVGSKRGGDKERSELRTGCCEVDRYPSGFLFPKGKLNK